MSDNQYVYSDEYYWEDRWKKNSIDFHKKDENPILVKHIDKLTQNKTNIKILLPLCGKSLDIKWLASIGHDVVGIEFVEDAIKSFFSENNISYQINEIENFKIYCSHDKKIKIYCGDFFKFTNKYESLFDAVWDRGGLVALPADLRKKEFLKLLKRFAENIQTLLKPNFRYILDSFEYDSSLYPGPPHLVTLDEITKLYGSKCKIENIDIQPYRLFSESLRESPPKEIVYLLSNH